MQDHDVLSMKLRLQFLDALLTSAATKPPKANLKEWLEKPIWTRWSAAMSALTIQLDDEAARLVQEAAQMAHQPLEFWLREQVCQAAACTVNGPKSSVRRVSPLHPGAVQPAPDFNAPLDEFAP